MLFYFGGGRDVCHRAWVWGSEAVQGSQFSPLTMWEPGIDLRSSGLASGTFTS